MFVVARGQVWKVVFTRINRQMNLLHFSIITTVASTWRRPEQILGHLPPLRIWAKKLGMRKLVEGKVRAAVVNKPNRKSGLRLEASLAPHSEQADRSACSSPPERDVSASLSINQSGGQSQSGGVFPPPAGSEGRGRRLISPLHIPGHRYGWLKPRGSRCDWPRPWRPCVMVLF